MSDVESWQYGFEWGPVTVERAMTLPNGGYVLEVRTPYKHLDVYVSKRGRSVRVFDRDKGELKVVPDES